MGLARRSPRSSRVVAVALRTQLGVPCAVGERSGMSPKRAASLGRGKAGSLRLRARYRVSRAGRLGRPRSRVALARCSAPRPRCWSRSSRWWRRCPCRRLPPRRRSSRVTLERRRRSSRSEGSPPQPPACAQYCLKTALLPLVLSPLTVTFQPAGDPARPRLSRDAALQPSLRNRSDARPGTSRNTRNTSQLPLAIQSNSRDAPRGAEPGRVTHAFARRQAVMYAHAMAAEAGLELDVRRRRRRARHRIFWRLVNPPTRLLAGFAPWWVLLETTGRRTRKRRTTPLARGPVDGEVVWLTSVHGRHATWVRNLETEPEVRIKLSGRWHRGHATIHDYDDATGARFNVYARSGPKTLGIDPALVRVELWR